MVRVLVVDDDEAVCRSLRQVLSASGFDVDATTSPATAIELLRTKSYDIAIYDLVMPDLDGMELLRETKKINSALPMIMITAFATIESAVEAMKRGASDYIEKPFKINEVQNTIRRVLEEAKFERRSSALTGTISDEIIKALSNPIRRQTLEYLYSRGKVRFRDIRDHLGIEDPAKLSFHLKILKQAHLIDQDQDRKYFLSTTGRETLEVLGKGQ